MFKTTALDHVANEYVDEHIPTSTPGTRLEADDRNILQDEPVNAVEASGQVLDATGVKRDQIARAMFLNGVGAQSMVDSGTANAKVLTPVTGASGYVFGESYAQLTGAAFIFKNTTKNTGAVTVDIGQTAGTLLGVKSLTRPGGAALVGSELLAGDYILIIYDLSNDRFEIILGSIVEQASPKNALINGNMLHAQRGASGSAVFTAATTPANDDDTYLIDRHINLSNGNDIVDVSQSTDAPVGSLLSYAMEVATINTKFGWFHIIEQKNCQHMIGGNVSLSFEAKVSDITKLANIKAMVISWDGAADAPTSDIISAWNAEDTNPTLVANWTAENTPADLGVTATWAKYKIENIAIDTASTKNIGVFIWSDGFCDTLGTILRITNVQLEKNSIATDFEWKSVGQELALCQQYFCKSYPQHRPLGYASSDNSIYFDMTALPSADHVVAFPVRFPVAMRNASPTITLYDMLGVAGKVTMIAGDGIAGSVIYYHDGGFCAQGTNGVANTGRRIWFHYGADAEIGV